MTTSNDDARAKDAERASANGPAAALGARPGDTDPIFPRARTILEELSADPEMIEMARRREAQLSARARELDEIRRRTRAEAENEAWNTGRVEGRAEGLAVTLLVAFQVRGLPAGAEEWARIIGCRDPDKLRGWIAAAATASSAAEVVSGG